MSLSVTPQAHDIVFTFNDSCNCLSPCCRSQEPKKVYVNSEGELESYKRRKARANKEEAYQRSLTHLVNTLNRKIVKFDGDPSVFSRKMENIFESIQSLREINLSHIEAINALMLVYLREESPKAHVTFPDQIVHPSMLIEEPPPIPKKTCEIL